MLSWNEIPFILLILSIKVAELKSEKALVIEASPLKAHFKDLGNDKEEKFSRILTACPASTPQEKEFDKKVSLSGNSVFARQFHPKSEHLKNIEQNVCDKPFKPAMVYDIECKEYEIGYELYYEDGKGIRLYQGNETYYHRYRPVKSIKNQTDHEILYEISLLRDFVIRYDDGPKKQNVKFNFTDGSRTLVFYWLPILSIKHSGDYKHISSDLSYWHFINTYNIPKQCKHYDSTDENIYTEENQEIYLKDISTPSPPSESQTKSCGNIYGCLVNSQIAPLQFYQTSAERFASCSYMNMIPVWKTIAQGQLKKVDAYTMAMDNSFHPYKVFGISDVLKMKTTANPNQPQKIFLSDPTNQKIIQIPKIIYRIIDHHTLRRRTTDTEDPSNIELHRYAAAIIIHNDPSPISDEDRLCSKESALPGWDRITNQDFSKGLTYVCPITVELNDKLRAYDNITSDTFKPLDVNAVPYSYLNNWDPEKPIFYQNHTGNIDAEYERIVREEFA